MKRRFDEGMCRSFASRLLASLTFFLLTGAAFTAEAVAPTQVMANLASYSGPDRTERLIAGAKKEGELMLYVSMPVSNLMPLIDGFKKKYGIEVKYWRGSGTQMMPRIVNEAKAERFTWDIMETTVQKVDGVRQEQLLQSVRSPAQEKVLIPELLPAHREWIASRLQLYAAGYNTDKIKPVDLPRTLEDLLDPRWKGKITMEAKNWDWFATLIKEIGEEKGQALFRKIVATNGVTVRDGHSSLTSAIISGEAPFALGIWTYSIDEAKAKGAPVDWKIIGPSIVSGAGMGVSRRAPHPHAALLFYDYVLTEGQKVLAESHLTPAMKIEGITTAVSRIVSEKKEKAVVVDPILLNEFDKWYVLYESIVIRKAGQTVNSR
jgi:iron(III) transport system substrate-binding protein